MKGHYIVIIIALVIISSATSNVTSNLQSQIDNLKDTNQNLQSRISELESSLNRSTNRVRNNLDELDRRYENLLSPLVQKQADKIVTKMIKGIESSLSLQANLVQNLIDSKQIRNIPGSHANRLYWYFEEYGLVEERDSKPIVLDKITYDLGLSPSELLFIACHIRATNPQNRDQILDGRISEAINKHLNKFKSK